VFAESASPFAFLFGGAPLEGGRSGRSAYAPGPANVPTPFGYPPGSYNASSLKRNYDPYEHEEQAVRPPPRAPMEVEKNMPAGPSPTEVMAAIKAAKGGDGPLGPFLNDPTLQAGDVLVTTKGFMVFRGEESQVQEDTDFVTIANASGLVANAKTLISLERASRLSPPKPLASKSKRLTPHIITSASSAAAQSAAR
jgi:hypothetical protein